MTPLDAKQRASLPDSAFAYIDSQRQTSPADQRRGACPERSRAVQPGRVRGRRRARQRAHAALRAAQKHGVVPIGFVRAQLQPQRRLPKGHVTFLLIDLEGSTTLLARLDDRYASLIAAVRRVTRRAVRQAGGHEVDARGDEFFAVFEQAPAALDAALAIQRAMGAGPWPDGADVRVRSGFTAAGRRSPTPGTSASPSMPRPASVTPRTAARSSCRRPCTRQRSLPSPRGSGSGASAPSGSRGCVSGAAVPGRSTRPADRLSTAPLCRPGRRRLRQRKEDVRVDDVVLALHAQGRALLDDGPVRQLIDRSRRRSGRRRAVRGSPAARRC